MRLDELKDLVSKFPGSFFAETEYDFLDILDKTGIPIGHIDLQSGEFTPETDERITMLREKRARSD